MDLLSVFFVAIVERHYIFKLLEAPAPFVTDALQAQKYSMRQQLQLCTEFGGTI